MARSIVLTVAKRFLFGSKDHFESELSKGFLSFIAAVSIMGLALGVTSLLVVTSVMNGYEKELKGALTAFHGHILLFSRGEPVENPTKFVEEIKTSFSNVEAVTPYVFSEVMLSSPVSVSGSIVEGIDRKSFEMVSDVPKKLREGTLPQETTGDVYEITLGSEVARKMNAKLGDEISLIVPFFQGDQSSLAVRVKVVGIIHLGMFDYDSKYSLMALKDLQKVLHLENKVNSFKIRTKDADSSLSLTEEMNEKFVYPLRARDWSSLNRNLFYALKLEKAVIAIILMVIILVASFNIISTIMMMAEEKKKQVAMLKALGFRPAQTFKLFWILGSYMAIVGAVLGVLIAKGLCSFVQWTSLIEIPADIYLFSKLPVEVRPVEWILITLCSIALAFFACIWPSFQMSRRLPVKGLHHD